VIVGIGALCVLAQRKNFVNQTPMEFAPDVLAAKARDIAASFGYTQRPVDRAFGWLKDLGYANYARTQPDAAKRMSQLGTNRPPALYFWYREAPRYFVPAGGGGVQRDNPPAAERGNLQMWLDSEGRLLQFQAWPEEVAATSGPADFQKVLAAAGFDPSKMTPAEPGWVPPSAFDDRAAWTGTEGSDPIRVETAAWRGRVVAFERLLPWKVTAPATDSTFANFFVVVLPLMAVAVAWRNLRLGRGDKRGATRLAGFVLVCTLTSLFLSSHHLPLGIEGFFIFTALRNALYTPVEVWLVYVAFEPYLRRYVPNTLIGWSRLLEGRWRDPLVGGHVLAGVAIGIGVSLLTTFGPGNPIAGVSLPTDASGSVTWLASMVLNGVAGTLVLTLLWLLFRIPARRNWLASILFIATTLVVIAPQFIPLGWKGFLGPGFLTVAIALVIVRFGVLATIAFVFTWYCAIAGDVPWTTSVSAWYARTAMLAIAAILALAIYGFRTTLAGRPLWRDELQKDAA
jgi:hypothetical protein